MSHGNYVVFLNGARNACEAGAPGAPLGASQVNQDSGHALVLSLIFLSMKVHYLFFQGFKSNKCFLLIQISNVTTVVKF